MAADDTPPVPAPAAAADPVVETTNADSNNAADNGDRNDRGQKRGRGRDNRNPNRDRNNPNNIKTGGFGSNKYEPLPPWLCA